MSDTTYLDWPFFSDAHRALARKFDDWAVSHFRSSVQEEDSYSACRNLVRLLGKSGWLAYIVPEAFGGAHPRLDLRSVCLIREKLAHESGLAEFAFAMQGLGSSPITLHGSDALQGRYLPGVCRGETIPAFAISEESAGSDVRAMRATAQRRGSEYVVNGQKTWISNAGLADFYVVFCRFPEQGENAFLALVVEADNPGLEVVGRIETIAPHPLGTIAFADCRVPSTALLGDEGKGLNVAFSTLDIFRTTVAAAALGYARRALEETVSHVRSRSVFGQMLADQQLTKARVAEMEQDIDCSALLVYRSAWNHDRGGRRNTRESALAKLFATECAQTVIDGAVQLFGARGVVAGSRVEALYREIRALRIYEGTSEIQKLIIAEQVLKRAAQQMEVTHG
ncbi:MAG TPA: acyl-CoA dehydrogenase family protein [Steroidobacteraceae bacterium]|nr:acyl-CoA dehydrogenase family protein [Steroidobacteraceae bacterium]